MSDVDEEKKQALEASSYSSAEKEEYASSLSLSPHSSLALSCPVAMLLVAWFDSKGPCSSFASRAAYPTSSVRRGDEGVEEPVGP